jgi:hypothetical protein
MKGDPYTLLAVSKWGNAALQWVGKIILVVKNERNGMKIVLVFNEDGSPHEWPKGMEEDVLEIAEQFREKILGAVS